MTTLQFTIPRTAADELPIESIVPGARELGISEPHLEYSTVHAGAGKMRITCAIDMAVYLIERLKQLAVGLEGRDETSLMIDCTYAIKAAFDAVDAELHRPPKRADGIRTSLN